MEGPNKGTPEPNYSLYVNARCARCGAAIFEEEGRRAADGRLLCRTCYSEEEAREHRVAPFQRSFLIPTPGVSLLEIIVVALILGILVSTALPPLLKMRAAAQEDALRVGFLINDNPAAAKQALDVVGKQGPELDGLVQQMAQAAGILAVDLPAFKADVMEFQKYTTVEAKAGSILHTIDVWKARVRPSLEEALPGD